VVKILRYRTFPHAVKTREGRVYFIRVGTTVREPTPSELALLFESAKEEVIKKPKLELLLVDGDGNSTTTINAQPTYTTIKKIKCKPPPAFYGVAQAVESMRQVSSVLYPFAEREPAPDLVPIGIEVSNVGEAPAYGIRIFLRFPENCEILSEHDAKGGLLLRPSDTKPTSGGLFVDGENNEASAWINELGNDLIMRKFDKVYVRFPPEEQEYKIVASIVQHNFPPENFEFIAKVKPHFEERIEYVYGE